jgi:chlorobactene glucosyltransferase
MPALLISSLLFILSLLIIIWLHNQYHMDIVVRPDGAPPRDGPLISVCIPARNEARNIRACVLSALGQDYPELEVIVVDDRSTDATYEILTSLTADARLTVIAGAELPAGWAGKPHALDQAARAARGEWLCFLDADTLMGPQALSACYGVARETQADLFTILTFQVALTFWERVIMPLIMTALSTGFSPRKVNDPARRDAIANGQFILIRRAVYAAIGGHASVRDQIVEDKAISERVKWSGYRLIVADGMQVARTRMYTSFAEIWEGWTKNIYLGLRDQPGLIMLGVFGAAVSLITAFLLPLWPLVGLYWFLHGGAGAALAVLSEALVIWAALIYVRSIVAARMAIPRRYAFSTPLGAAVVAAMMFASAWKVISGRGVTWRGRRYAVR